MRDKLYCLPDALHNPGSEKTQGNQLDAIHITKRLFPPDASELCVLLEADNKAWLPFWKAAPGTNLSELLSPASQVTLTEFRRQG